MAEEVVPIKLQIDPSVYDEAGRRFEGLARQASQALSSGLRSGLPGGTGAAGQRPGGGSFLGGLGGGVGGTNPAQALDPLGIFRGVGQGISRTPAASVNDPRTVAKNAFLGGTESLLNNTVGQVPIVGDYLKAQFNSVKEAMEVPTERAVSSLKGVYGNLAAAGYQASEAELQEAAKFRLGIERRRYEGERQVERVTRSIEARDSLSYGLSFLGR